MNNDQFERERRYQSTLAVVQHMLRLSLITEDEFKAINTMLLEKHRPLLSCLHTETTNNKLNCLYGYINQQQGKVGVHNDE
jgi:hypothetical protein